eukprot:c20657_g1_i1 orf=2-355(-)
MQRPTPLTEGLLQGSLPSRGPWKQQEPPQLRPHTDMGPSMDVWLAHSVLGHRGFEKKQIDTWSIAKLQKSGTCVEAEQKAPHKDAALKVCLEFHDRSALLDSLKACGKQKALRKGSTI